MEISVFKNNNKTLYFAFYKNEGPYFVPIGTQIKFTVKKYLEEYLPDIIEETLDDLLQNYMNSPEPKDGYSLLVISPDKSKVCRFYGQGQIDGPYTFNNKPERYCITIPAQGRNMFISDYDTKEAAAEALKAIFDAYNARYTKIEL